MMAPDILARFDVDPAEYEGLTPNGDGHRVLNVRAFRRGDGDAGGKDRSATWLRNAMLALGLLAVAAAVVSFAAQYRMVLAAKNVPAIAALEAGIPDAAALIFACLGIALALQGKRAVRARILNVGAVAASITMNYLAAGSGWRDAAIWVMPPVAYALASDTAIGVVRAWAIARQESLAEALADDESGPLAIVGRAVLYILRFAVAPASTARGARRALLLATPLPEPAAPKSITKTRPRATRTARHRGHGETKTARFLRLVAERHGELASLPLDRVAAVAGELAPAVSLDAGSARRELRAAVQAAQDGGEL